MKLKLTITIMILVITIILPSVAESAQVIDRQFEVDKNSLFLNDIPIFIVGRVSNVTEHQHSYMIPYYTFNCEDVKCIYGFMDRPIIRHFTNKEQFFISVGEYYYRFFDSRIIAIMPLFIWFILFLNDIFYP